VKVTKDKIENSQAFLTIEMELAEVEASLDEAYHRLVKKANIPGFRKGKAPRAVLERYLGREGLFEEALNHTIPQAYEAALKEQEIEAFAQPQIEVTQTEPLVFKATVPLPPMVQLGDYQDVRVTPKPVTVGDKDVDRVIEQLRHQHATWEPVDRPVVDSDLVALDIESTIEGKSFINRQGLQYQVAVDHPFPAPGFAQQVVGMKGGEEKQFTLQFPEDESREELVGKEVSFQIKIGEIKQGILPELTDDFAVAVDAELKTLELLRERVTTNLQLRAEEESRLDFEEQVMVAVVAGAQIEYPPILVEREIDRLLEQQQRRWQGTGTDFNEYLSRINKTEVELREQLRPVATTRVNGALVLEKVADAETIEVSEAETDEEMSKLIADSPENKNEWQQLMDTAQGRDSVRQLLTRRKTMQRLLDIAAGSVSNVETLEKEESA